MTLELYFRLIMMSIFQSQICYNKKSFTGEPMSYDNQLFYCPKIVCKDGWSVSLQISSGSGVSSENGYKKIGHSIKTVSFSSPSKADKALLLYNDNELLHPSGIVPISVIQKICNNHGGIDWEATISPEQFNYFVFNK